jgi:hypothetical protein
MLTGRGPPVCVQLAIEKFARERAAAQVPPGRAPT